MDYDFILNVWLNFDVWKLLYDFMDTIGPDWFAMDWTD